MVYLYFIFRDYNLKFIVMDVMFQKGEFKMSNGDLQGTSEPTTRVTVPLVQLPFYVSFRKEDDV